VFSLPRSLALSLSVSSGMIEEDKCGACSASARIQEREREKQPLARVARGSVDKFIIFSTLLSHDYWPAATRSISGDLERIDDAKGAMIHARGGDIKDVGGCLTDKHSNPRFLNQRARSRRYAREDALDLRSLAREDPAGGADAAPKVATLA